MVQISPDNLGRHQRWGLQSGNENKPDWARAELQVQNVRSCLQIRTLLLQTCANVQVKRHTTYFPIQHATRFDVFLHLWCDWSYRSMVHFSIGLIFFVWNRFSWYRWTKLCFIWLPFISFSKVRNCANVQVNYQKTFCDQYIQWNTTLLRWYHSNSSNSCCLSLIKSKFYKCVNVLNLPFLRPSFIILIMP